MDHALKEFPVLYVLMRDDLESMNAGKAMAQSNHASDAFNKLMLEKFNAGGSPTAYWARLYQKWKNETSQGFGTVLTLAVNEVQLRTAIDVAKHFQVPADIIHDPSYPLVDGEVVHYLPLDTCGFVFGDKNFIGALVQNFDLHRRKYEK